LIIITAFFYFYYYHFFKRFWMIIIFFTGDYRNRSIYPKKDCISSILSFTKHINAYFPLFAVVASPTFFLPSSSFSSLRRTHNLTINNTIQNERDIQSNAITTFPIVSAFCFYFFPPLSDLNFIISNSSFFHFTSIPLFADHFHVLLRISILPSS